MVPQPIKEELDQIKVEHFVGCLEIKLHKRANVLK